MSAKKKSKSRKKKAHKDPELDFLKKLTDESSDSVSDSGTDGSVAIEGSDTTDGEVSASEDNADEHNAGNNSSNNSIAERLIFLAWLMKCRVRILFVHQLWRR